MRLFGFFDQRIRGFRIVELGAATVLLVLVLVVYLAKTGASGKRADIDRIQDEITAEQTQIRLLNAEVAHQEQPERLEALATRYLGLQPIPAKHEVPVETLPDLANLAAAQAAKPAPSAPDPALAGER
jgi:cell division protein FtsL